MSKRKKIFFIFIFIFFSFSNVYSSEKVAFVNIDYLIKNSNLGKIALKNISEADKKNLNLLKKRNESLKELELEIKKKQNIISEEAFKNEVNEFKNKANEFTKEKNLLVKEFNTFKKKELNKVFEKISPIVREYMSDNSISILMDTKNIFIGDVNADITKPLLRKINEIVN